MARKNPTRSGGRIRYNRGSASDTIAAAKMVAEGQSTRYVFATHFGFVIDKGMPPGHQGYFQVDPDGTVTTFAWQGGKRQAVYRERPVGDGLVEVSAWEDGALRVLPGGPRRRNPTLLMLGNPPEDALEPQGGGKIRQEPRRGNPPVSRKNLFATKREAQAAIPRAKRALGIRGSLEASEEPPHGWLLILSDDPTLEQAPVLKGDDGEPFLSDYGDLDEAGLLDRGGDVVGLDVLDDLRAAGYTARLENLGDNVEGVVVDLPGDCQVIVGAHGDGGLPQTPRGPWAAFLMGPEHGEPLAEEGPLEPAEIPLAVGGLRDKAARSGNPAVVPCSGCRDAHERDKRPPHFDCGCDCHVGRCLRCSKPLLGGIARQHTLCADCGGWRRNPVTVPDDSRHDWLAPPASSIQECRRCGVQRQRSFFLDRPCWALSFPKQGSEGFFPFFVREPGQYAYPGEPSCPPTPEDMSQREITRRDNPRTPKTFAPGDVVRYTGEFLRNVGMARGSWGTMRFPVKACSCGICRTGPYVLVDSYGDDLHVNTANVEKVAGGRWENPRGWTCPWCMGEYGGTGGLETPEWRAHQEECAKKIPRPHVYGSKPGACFCPRCTGRQGNPRTTAAAYLEEVINYGGIPTRRGDAIRDMRDNGVSKEGIDRWLQGYEASQRRRANPTRFDEKGNVVLTRDEEKKKHSDYIDRKKRSVLFLHPTQGTMSGHYVIDDSFASAYDEGYARGREEKFMAHRGKGPPADWRERGWKYAVGSKEDAAFRRGNMAGLEEPWIPGELDSWYMKTVPPAPGRTGNPSGATRRAFERFHNQPARAAENIRVPSVAGVPAECIALGELVEIEIEDGSKRGTYTPDRLAFVAYSPKTETLYVVPERGALDDIRKLDGTSAVSITYRPHEESGKERADYQHDFEKPLPKLRATGGKALRFAGGGYSVSDWIHD